MLNDEYCNGCDLLLLACELLCTLSEGVKANVPSGARFNANCNAGRSENELIALSSTLCYNAATSRSPAGRQLVTQILT